MTNPSDKIEAFLLSVHNLKVVKKFNRRVKRPLKIVGIVVGALVGLYIVVLLGGWGVFLVHDFVSNLYLDRYFCGPSSIEKASAGVVRIETEDGSGSGFWIDKDLVLTNNHVVLFDNDIQVINSAGTSYHADIVQTDTIKDIAILRIVPNEKYEDPKVLKWRTSWANLAEDVFGLGFPEGTTDITVTKGIVSSLTSDEVDSTRYIQTDAAINPGNSGGPLVDVCGRVLGISSSSLRDAQNIGYAIDIPRIKDQLSEMIVAAKNITPEELAHQQTGGETEAVIKYYLALSKGDFEGAYDFYSKDLKGHVLFKGWKDSYKNTFAVRFKSAIKAESGLVDVTFLTLDYPNNDKEDFAQKEFNGTWKLIKEDGIWKLDSSNIKEVPVE